LIDAVEQVTTKNGMANVPSLMERKKYFGGYFLRAAALCCKTLGAETTDNAER